MIPLDPIPKKGKRIENLIFKNLSDSAETRGEDLKQLAGGRDPLGGGHHQEAVLVIPGHGLQHLLTQLGQFDKLESNIHVHVDRNLKKLRCRFVFMLIIKLMIPLKSAR